MSKTLHFNELPRPTFRWLKVNHTEGNVWAGTERATVTVEGSKHIVTDITNKELLESSYKGVHAGALRDASHHFTHGYHIQVPAGAKEALTIVLDVQGAVSERTRLQIEAEKDSTLELTLCLKGEATDGHIGLLSEIVSHTGASVVFKKVQLLTGKVQQFEHRYTRVEESGHVEFINIELGGSEIFLNYQEDLVGDYAEVEHDLGYCGTGTQVFDIAMLMKHIGRKTISNINNLGALNGSSKKSFRGTLDFLRGSIASEGAEEDTCLLLTPQVKSISLPLLLCKEDNVSGNHASSAGQLDPAKLFYLMSRGFNEEEAKHIIVESMLRPLIDRIGHEEMEEAALAVLRQKI